MKEKLTEFKTRYDELQKKEMAFKMEVGKFHDDFNAWLKELTGFQDKETVHIIHILDKLIP